MTEIYLTRHGETQNNLEDRYTGWQDIPLTPNGFAQAQNSASKLLEANIDIIISSPLLRAKQTADQFAEKLGCPVILENGLKERSCGTFAGNNKTTILKKYQISYQEYINGFTPENGETIYEIRSRVQKGINQILTDNKNRTILIVAHSFVTKLVNAIILNLDDNEMLNFKLKNCEIFHYKIPNRI